MEQTAGTSVPGLVQLVLNASTETSVVLVICALCSLISWYVIGAKWWEFRRLRSARKAFDAAVARSRSTDERAVAATRLGDSPYADIVQTSTSFIADLHGAMERANVSRTGLSLTQLEALTMTLDTRVREEADQAGRMIPWLATIGSTAPLLGLFGTVLGIMKSFNGLSVEGSSNLAAVAPGIADALIATAAGLGAAIPAVVAYNIFTSRTERFEGELERLAQETIGALGREGKL
ncbi:MAG: MotA/TolQ/ExbB proton channel family protein [Gemmatimonadales bacterium]